MFFNRACCIKNCKSASFLICISTDSEYFSANGFQIEPKKIWHSHWLIVSLSRYQFENPPDNWPDFEFPLPNNFRVAEKSDR